MTLTTNGLNWLAQNAGIGDCFASTGVTYTDADGISHTGGTKDAVTAFVVADMVGKGTAIIIAGTNYNGFKVINDNTALEMSDVAEAADREADGGTYPKYCKTVTPVCTPGTVRCKSSAVIEKCKTDGSGWYDYQTCPTGKVCSGGACVDAGACPPLCRGADLWAYKRDASGACIPDYRITENSETCPGYVPPGSKKVAPPMEFTFLAPCDGVPTVRINIEMLGMRQEGDTFYISGFKVQNTRECVAHFAMQLKIWDLAPGAAVPVACPTVTPEWEGVSRSTWDPEEPYIRTTTIEPGETETINMNFFVPPSIRGRKSLCIYVWGNFSKFALFDELETELGEV